MPYFLVLFSVTFFVKARVERIEILFVELIRRKSQALAEALIVYDLSLAGT